MVKVNGGPNLDIAATNTANSTYALTCFLYLKGNERSLYQTIEGVFQQTNGGVLIKGAPLKPPPGAKRWTDFNAKGLLDRMY